MGLFKKKDRIEKTPLIQYSETDQGTPPPPPPLSPLDELRSSVAKVLENQRTIVQNQQVILDAITATQQQMIALAEATPQEDPEPTPEELKAAALALRKKGGKK